MTKWLIKWKMREQFYSLPQEEMTKVNLSLLEMTKADIDANKDSMQVQVYASSGEGYTIFEGSETQVYETVLKYSSYVSFEVIPVIQFGQHYEITKKLAAATR